VERYLARMRRRATPFSLMAGYSVGKAGGESVPISFPARPTWRRIVRVDADCATAIIQSSMADKERREQAQWIRRGDLVILPDVVRVAVRDIHNRDSLAYADIVRSKALDHVFSLAAKPIKFSELVDGIEQFSSTVDQARSYAHALIDRGLLVPFALPSIASDDILASLQVFDRRLAAAAATVYSTRLDQNVDVPMKRLTAAIARAQQSDRTDNLIFDLLKPLDSGVIGDDVLAEASSVLRVLQRTTSPIVDARLAEFGERFRDLYEMREVPLVEALDENRGAVFPVQARYESSNPKLERWLFSLFERACRKGADEIVLNDADIPADELWQPSECFSIMFKLARDPLSIFEPSISASPGTTYFARATSFEPGLKEAAKGMLRELVAQHPDADMAEIVHFLPGKFAAFGQIPRLMPLELSVAARPADVETSIDLNDLLLAYQGAGQFTLRSIGTGRPVLPRMIGAANLNRADNTSLCRFLGAVARHHKIAYGWSWDGLKNSSWVPRVRYGHHVLSSQSWRLSHADTEALLGARTEADRRDAVARLRADRGLPRHISYCERADEWLAVNLEDDWSIAAWLDIAKSKMTVAEAFPVERSAVTGANGAFHHELLLPFIVDLPGVAASRDHDVAPEPARTLPIIPLGQTFDRAAPGGEVLYLSLYGDKNELLAIAFELFEVCIEPALKDGKLDRWFFLPFSTRMHHVRIRCFGSSESLYRLLSASHPLLQGYIESRVLHSVSIETYDRETYRYGGAYGLELAELVFQASSEFALEFHNQFDIVDAKIPEIMAPLVGSLRAILAATGLSLEAQRDLARLAARLYHRDVPDPENAAAAPRPRDPGHLGGDYYREIKTELRQPELVTPGYEDLVRKLTQVLGQIREGVASGKITRAFDRLVIDYLHVHSIRLLTTWARDIQFEEIGYHVLARSLSTELHAPLLSLNPISAHAPPASHSPGQRPLAKT
jgi:thiopeptide-type bacteriocin biosynthesis protein